MRGMWRTAVGVAGAAALTGALVLGPAIPAGAEPSETDHSCPQEPFGTIDDDGMVTDVIHHDVEPLLPTLHEGSCQLRLVELQVEILLRPEAVPNLVGGLACFLKLGPCF